MRRGRKPAGAELVDGLDGSKIAKERLRQILRTLTGKATIEEASCRLNLSPSRFHELRKSAIADMLKKLEPRPAGRPRRRPAATDDPMSALEGRLRDLEVELRKVVALNELNTFLPLLARTGRRSR